MSQKHDSAFLKLVEDAKTRVREITVEDVAKKLEQKQDFVLIDCREDREWDAGHAAGAIHIGKGVIERDIQKKAPDPSKELVIYCGGGFRSALAGDALLKMGYQNVLSMAGGIRAWREAQLPEEKPPQ